MRSRFRVGRRTVPIVALLTVIAATAYPSIAGAAGKAKLTVVHAIPRLTVDVYANGDLLLDNFKPGTITRPVPLNPGRYDVAVTPSDSKKKLLAASTRVKSQTDAAAVAYLDEEGDPTLGWFKNNMRPVQEHDARITVRHTAEAPEVDVRFKRPGRQWRKVTSDLENGEQANRDLKARRYRFDVVLAGTTKRVLGPVSLKIDDRTHYFVYAWGSVADENLALDLSTRRLPSSN
jgi:Domain of unknown function (DUF4397)